MSGRMERSELHELMPDVEKPKRKPRPRKPKEANSKQVEANSEQTEAIKELEREEDVLSDASSEAAIKNPVIVGCMHQCDEGGAIYIVPQQRVKQQGNVVFELQFEDIPYRKDQRDIVSAARCNYVFCPYCGVQLIYIGDKDEEEKEDDKPNADTVG